MRVLPTGADGYLRREVGHAALDVGHHVADMACTDAGRRALALAATKSVPRDRYDPVALTEAARAVDGVIEMARAVEIQKET